ncbi:hypothetical protein [Microcystis phage Mvi-JY20]|uniref:ATPase AAA-type core domain-containing protein n=1 Tax=Microcystis phage Mvi-JY20 TaxID=3128146 RepID=A0AAX4QGI0_9CAUD
MTIKDHALNVKYRNRRIDEIVAQISRLDTRFEDTAKELTLATDAAELAKQAIYLKAGARQQVQALVSELLTYVFSEQITFVFEDKLDAEDNLVGFVPRLIRGELSSSYTGHGHGAANLISFACRLSCLLLNGKVAPVLVLDEPATNLDAEKWSRLLEFVNILAERYSLQIIMVTHSPVSGSNNITVTSRADGSSHVVIRDSAKTE